jgi:hypothetical protein
MYLEVMHNLNVMSYNLCVCVCLTLKIINVCSWLITLACCVLRSPLRQQILYSEVLFFEIFTLTRMFFYNKLAFKKWSTSTLFVWLQRPDIVIECIFVQCERASRRCSSASTEISFHAIPSLHLCKFSYVSDCSVYIQ